MTIISNAIKRAAGIVNSGNNGLTRRAFAFRVGSAWLGAQALSLFSRAGKEAHAVPKRQNPQAGASRLAAESQPRAAIVAADKSFYRFVAGDLQRYFEKLSGAKLPVIAPVEARRLPADFSWVLVGGREANELVNEIAAKKQVSFKDLKKDGFVLRTVRTGERTVLVVGGDDEASTMYAAYDLLERYGIVFLLSRDILPEPQPDLEVLELNVRAETPFTRRGFLISNIYPNRGIWHLAEVKSFLDQMAKLKMNFLQFFWFEHEPWIKFGYHDEVKLLGDATGKETGYMMWRYNFGSYLTQDLPVGREFFSDRPRMAPLEFQKVETPEDAFQVARDFLNEIILYARTRKIEVWLCIDPTTLPGNLARFATRAANASLPFGPIGGTLMCPADPVLHEINANRLKALISTYPEAEGYFLYIPEQYPRCHDQRDQTLLREERPKYQGLIQVMPHPVQWGGSEFMKHPEAVRDSVAGSVHIIQKFMEARNQIAPVVKLGIGGLGHAYALPFLDKMFPRDVPFTDMESRAVWTPGGVPMQYFGGMGERDRTLVPRVDDDGSMFGMQFNVGLYFKDRVLAGSVENGVTGFAGQLNRARGTEQNYRYLAEAAWEPTLTPKEFYARYARRMFGEPAWEEMAAAFAVLEENEAYLGWRGQKNFWCCSPIPEVGKAYELYQQPNPFDGPQGWEDFITECHDRVRYFIRSVQLLERALQHLNQADPSVAPHGKREVAYLKNKTYSYSLHLQTLIAARQGYIQLEEAFRLWKTKSIGRPEFRRRLDSSLVLFSSARKRGRQTTETFAQVIDHPSDLGVLYRANVFLVIGFELVEQTIQNVVNFHHGSYYVARVPWDKIYHDFPRFSHAR